MASRHDKAGVLTYADGHGETHKWVSPTTCKPVTRCYHGLHVDGDRRDLNWLKARTSVLTE